jgi:hypothetical protein
MVASRSLFGVQNETGTASLIRFLEELLELFVRSLECNEVKQAKARLCHFIVFDGACRIVIEARSEEDAVNLCAEMGWELICVCDD